MSDTASLIEKLRLKAQAEKERRKRAGVWHGQVVAHTEYQTRPLDWIVDKLGVPRHTIQWSLNHGYGWCSCDRCTEAGHVGPHRWDGDPDPFVLALDSLAEGKDCGIESATGTGKTFLAACVTLWFLAAFEKSIVSQWAPVEKQLLLHMWKEIGELFPRFKQHFPHAQLLTGKLRMMPPDESGGETKEVWAATANVAGVGANEEAATRAQGLHAEHMLIITEETPGISPAIMVALDNTRTADHNVQLSLGNPDHRQDELHKFCEVDSTVKVRISAYDHPNIVTKKPVIPAAIGPRRLQERIRKLGKGSRLYGSRIRGISPAESSEALIKWEWCEDAAERYFDPDFRRGVAGIGADVANSQSGDRAAIARWVGSCLTEVVSQPCPNANHFGAQLAKEIEDQGVDRRHVGIDPIGVGAGAVNEMARLGVKVRHLGGGARAVPGLDTDHLWSITETDLEGNLRPAGKRVVDAQRFNNLRSQIWWTMREDLRLGRIALPNDPELFEDLTTPEWEQKNGVIVVEKKEDIQKRIGRSPDKGDAAVYGNFVRRRAPMSLSERQELLPEEREPDREYGLEKLLVRENERQKHRARQVMRAISGGRHAYRPGRHLR